MIIKHINKVDTKGTFIHVVDGTNNFPSNFPNDLIEAIADFEKGSKNQLQVTSVHAIFIIVKSNLVAEVYRKEGAKIAAKIDELENAICVTGNVESIPFLVEGLALASYKFTKYFTDEKKRVSIKEIFVDQKVPEKQLSELNTTIKAVFWARDMVNEPLSYLTAEKLSDEIKSLEQSAKLTVSVLGKAQIEALKMGGLLAVNKGSIDPPTFTIVEYKPENAKNKKPIVLVGKGVVYDTGGLSLKPTAGSMDVMKSDMGGAAAVVGAIYLAAMQELDVHVIALVPATDNRPGLNAYVPGDIITMYDGTTVEVLNTDAEGRMILADALAYSKKYDPELVIDAATLTGAAVRAIGHYASIIMGNADQSKFDAFLQAGNTTFDRVVQLPFWDEYYEEMKSTIADLKNIGGPNAGMISAGKFLEHFVKSPYIHMDIAGPAWLDKASAYNTAGGTGAGVRVLVEFLKNYK